MANKAVIAFVGVGSNLSGHYSDSQALIDVAINAISRIDLTCLLAPSSYYRSAPVDATGPDYVNAVVKLQTDLDAIALLDALQTIETQFARERPFKNAPRTLDLDLLSWDNATLNEVRLTLPHPRLTERAFVVLPLLEIQPDFAIPGLGNVQEWRRKTSNQQIERISKSPND